MKICHMQSQAIDNIMKTIGSGRSRGGPGAYHLPILDSMNFFRENGTYLFLTHEMTFQCITNK